MIEENNYLIHAVGFAPIKFYGNAQQAIAKGSSYCYVQPLHRDALLRALLAGGSCQWQYGFDSVLIELDE